MSNIICHSKLTTMYPGRPYSYYHFCCEHDRVEYGMSWIPPRCPICGCVLVVTERAKSNGGERSKKEKS